MNTKTDSDMDMDMDMASFLQRHRPELQELLEQEPSDLIGNARADAIICRIEQELEGVSGPGPWARDLLPGEDVFLWCLDQLALLVDPGSGFTGSDPYARHLLADLKDMAPRLRNGEPLPPGREIHFVRPFDEDDPEWDEFLDEDESEAATDDADQCSSRGR